MGDPSFPFGKGFLNSVFNPGKTPVHASDFSFLEKPVYAFSASGSDGATDPNAKPVVRPKKEDFKPLQLAPEVLQAGSDTMLSRLFNANQSDSFRAHSLTSRFTDFLNSNDKDVLKRLYSVAQSRNEDLSKIDHVAISIAHYRLFTNLF